MQCQVYLLHITTTTYVYLLLKKIRQKKMERKKGILQNGILFDYFVGKTMTQTISLLKSCFPYYWKGKSDLKGLFLFPNVVRG